MPIDTRSPIRIPKKVLLDVEADAWLRDANGLMKNGCGPLGQFAMGTLCGHLRCGHLRKEGSVPSFAVLKRASEVKTWDEFWQWERALRAGQPWT